MKDNIIKTTCKELGLTYKQLADEIGLTEGSIKRLASSDDITTQVIKSIEMLKKIKNLESQIQDSQELKTLLKKFIG